MCVVGSLGPPDALYRVLEWFPIPPGLQPALVLHTNDWQAALLGSDRSRGAIALELSDPRVASLVREAFERDFWAIVYTALRLEPGVLDVALRGVRIRDGRKATMRAVDWWLKLGGRVLLRGRFDRFTALGPNQKNAVRRGFYELVDDVIAWTEELPEDIYCKMARLSGMGKDTFATRMRQVRGERCRRTGTSMPSRRAKAGELSWQSFRRTLVFQRIGGRFAGLMPPPAGFKRHLLGKGIASPCAPNPETRLLRKQRTIAGSPSEMVRILPDGVWEGLAGLVHDRRKRVSARRVLSGALLVIERGAQWRAVPRALGAGSGTTILRRLVEWKHNGTWQGIVQTLQAAPAYAGLEFDRVERVGLGSGTR
jgi:transposase